jgi:hypothetical protein
MKGSSNRLVPLTFGVVALSVAIAVVGSSTLLFPGPDIGDRPAQPSARDFVDRVIAPVFALSPARERGETPAPPVEAPAGIAPEVPLVSIPASVTTERPVRGRPDGGATARPRSDGRPPSGRADDGGGKAKGKGKAKTKAKADKAPGGQAVAGAKSQGHGQGHLKSEPPRGPKQPHVQPAKGHGKAKGHARAHARAGR